MAAGRRQEERRRTFELINLMRATEQKGCSVRLEDFAKTGEVQRRRFEIPDSPLIRAELHKLNGRST